MAPCLASFQVSSLDSDLTWTSRKRVRDSELESNSYLSPSRRHFEEKIGKIVKKCFKRVSKVKTLDIYSKNVLQARLTTALKVEIHV